MISRCLFNLDYVMTFAEYNGLIIIIARITETHAYRTSRDDEMINEGRFTKKGMINYIGKPVNVDLR